MRNSERYTSNTGIERRAWAPYKYLLGHPRIEWNPYTKKRPYGSSHIELITSIQACVILTTSTIIKQMMES